MLSDDDLDLLLRQLPPPPLPQGGYVPALSHGELVVSAGMTPRIGGAIRHRGQVGVDLTVEEAQEAAAIAVGNALSATLAAIGVTSLPGNACVELELTCALASAGSG